MLSTPSASALRHASRSSVIVHCCGWMVTPTLNRLGSPAVAPWAFCMATEFIPRKVVLDSADAEFWRRYHKFRRTRHDELHPDDPFPPDDVERMRVLSDQKFEIIEAFEVVHEGEMVSWFRSAVPKPEAPGYETNRHFLWCTFSVLAPYRRRGIARSHLPLVLELME